MALETLDILYILYILVLKFSQSVQCLYLRRGGFSVIKVISQCVPAIREKTKYVRMLKAGLRAISLFPFVSLTPGDISPARERWRRRTVRLLQP